MDYTSHNCPCGGQMVPVLYGYPDTKMVEHARGGMIALGGCSPSDITHYCYSCNATYTVKSDQIFPNEQ